jgi:hypothetical protein
MSMLTPPGMGGKYRITGNAYPRMRRPRRRRRALIGGLSVVVALGLAGWGTFQLGQVFGVFDGDDKGQKVTTAAEKAGCPSASPSPSPSSSPSPAAKAKTAQIGSSAKHPAPAEITVNVFNATTRGGLAKQTADALEKRGFKIGNVGNAPAEYDKKVKTTGLLLGAPTAQDSSLTVLATQLTGAERKADTRKGNDVDLIIGDAYTSLTNKELADKALTALDNPAPAPRLTC